MHEVTLYKSNTDIDIENCGLGLILGLKEPGLVVLNSLVLGLGDTLLVLVWS